MLVRDLHVRVVAEEEVVLLRELTPGSTPGLPAPGAIDLNLERCLETRRHDVSRHHTSGPCWTMCEPTPSPRGPSHEGICLGESLPTCKPSAERSFERSLERNGQRDAVASVDDGFRHYEEVVGLRHFRFPSRRLGAGYPFGAKTTLSQHFVPAREMPMGRGASLEKAVH